MAPQASDEFLPASCGPTGKIINVLARGSTLKTSLQAAKVGYEVQLSGQAQLRHHCSPHSCSQLSLIRKNSCRSEFEGPEDRNPSGVPGSRGVPLIIYFSAERKSHGN
jgi:hypothetical protein